MKIAIVGYGKMGQMIERAAKARGIAVVATIDPSNKNAMFSELNAESVTDADVCIDFSHPSVVMNNIGVYCTLGKNAVIGTTGWYEHMDKVRALVKKSGIGLIWSGNFSIGVNMYFRILERAAQIANSVEEYDVFGVEYHHSEKADSPSGTMKMIGDMLVKNIDRKKSAVYDRSEKKIKADEIHLASVRGGSIPGIHEIVFDSDADTITIRHSAKNREGFAKGAVMAAEFISRKKGFFGIDDLMDKVITE
jgi:4-hydroxy-tetrahydrodipicolinate reductase